MLWSDYLDCGHSQNGGLPLSITGIGGTSLGKVQKDTGILETRRGKLEHNREYLQILHMSYYNQITCSPETMCEFFGRRHQHARFVAHRVIGKVTGRTILETSSRQKIESGCVRSFERN